MQIRKAERKDVAKILEFINNLAVYEHMENDVVATPELYCRNTADRVLVKGY